MPELSGKQVQAPQSFGTLAVGPRSLQLGVSPAFGVAARLWNGGPRWHATTVGTIACAEASAEATVTASHRIEGTAGTGKHELRAEKRTSTWRTTAARRAGRGARLSQKGRLNYQKEYAATARGKEARRAARQRCKEKIKEQGARKAKDTALKK